MAMFLAEINPTVWANAGCGHSILEIAACILTALLVIAVETRRIGERTMSHMISGFSSNCRGIMTNCVCEGFAVAICFSLALFLRYYDTSEYESETWVKVKSQWPLLITADSLLSLQTMLRLIVFSSVLFRSGRFRMLLPLADEAATLQFGAHAMRILVLFKSTTYMLEGPLGGRSPVLCDTLALPILASLCPFNKLKAYSIVAAVTGIGVAWVASHHHLNLAGEANIADQAFIAAHILDLFSACTYFSRSLMIADYGCARTNASVGCTHILLMAQQSMSAYYFVHAFEPSSGLVGAGLPFEILQFCNLMQLGLYCAVAILFFAENKTHSVDFVSKATSVPSEIRDVGSSSNSGVLPPRSIVL